MAGVGMGETLTGIEDLILVLNSGSSSLKFGMYYRVSDSDELPLLTGSAEGIGRSSGALHIRSADGKPLVTRESILESQSGALAAVATAIREHVHTAPVAVGHRVVHGGPNLRDHQLITPHLLDQLRAAAHFAPLHIPQALALIASAQSIFPAAAHYACFDDAFHRTMPEIASHLPLPQCYFDAGIRRYGFHGLSYESLVHHLGEQLPRRAIFAHLGNGASLCALRDGVSIDTTMGFTPTGGILMGTRSGDLDPGALFYLARQRGLSLDQLERICEHESGLRALGGTSDMRTLLAEAGRDPRAALAVAMFGYAIRKAIGAFAVALGGLDLLVFTGGIGAHAAPLRAEACVGLEAIGVQLDPSENQRGAARISTPHSRCAVRVIVADEESTMARQARAVISAPARG